MNGEISFDERLAREYALDEAIFGKNERWVFRHTDTGLASSLTPQEAKAATRLFGKPEIYPMGVDGKIA